MLALQLAFYLLFAAALLSYIRQPGPLALDVLLMFGALAGLFAFQFVRVVLPEASDVIGFVSLALLVAQPGLALRLTRHFSDLPRWTGPAMLAGYLVAMAALLLAGAEQPLALWLAVAYFLVGDGLAAALLIRQAPRRGASARWRLLLAAAGMALLALTILALVVGGPLGSIVVRVVAWAAALAFVIAFLPPPWLRRIWRQATAYDFLTDLARLQPGSGTARVWRELAEAARGLTNAIGVQVRLTGQADPVAAAGSPDEGITSTEVAFGNGERRGAISLSGRGPVFFAEDDLALLAALGALAALAVEHEAALAERTALAERVAATNVELARASAAKSDFLAAMSHELRTPLNAIIGFSELLHTPQVPLTEVNIHEYAGHIHGAGLHLLELVNDILDLSRVEAGRLDLRHEPTDVGLLLAETLATVRPLAESRQLTIETDAPTSLIAEVDPSRLRQVVYNLLSNAIKFTPANGKVMVSLAAEDNVLALAVADTGPGIPAEDQERIFAAFEQLQPGAAEGTGLGLALTRRLVEAHGGQIELVSTPGVGSRFGVRLPLRREVQAQVSPVAADDGHGPLVLVVEDDAAAAELLRLQLRQAGYRAAIAPDGESGLAAAIELAPAAILLDILLPGLDGWEVLKQLRAEPATATIPVMVISIVEDAALGLALGAVDYFVKPVSRDTLLAALGRLTLTTKVRERTVNVLAIDDDPHTLALYRHALTPDGFHVIEAGTGEEGLAQARTAAVDAIVLDILLPDLDGFEIATRLKADPSTADIPIIVVTGRLLSEEDKERLNGRVQAVLAKGEDAVNGLRDWLDQIDTRMAA